MRTKDEIQSDYFRLCAEAGEKGVILSLIEQDKIKTEKAIKEIHRKIAALNKEASKLPVPTPMETT